MVVTMMIWWFLLMIRVSVDVCDSDDDDDHGDVDEYDLDKYKIDGTILWW